MKKAQRQHNDDLRIFITKMIHLNSDKWMENQEVFEKKSLWQYYFWLA